MRLFCCDTIQTALLDFIEVSPMNFAVKWNVCLADDILFLNREKTKQSLQVGSDNYLTGGYLVNLQNEQDWKYDSFIEDVLQHANLAVIEQLSHFEIS